MPVRSRQLLPVVLSNLRRKASLSQKQVALSAALDQSYLCALEKGRRSLPGEEIVTRLIAALGITGFDEIELRWAIAHDQILSALAEVGLTESADVLSVALQASRLLSAEERRGLCRYLEQLWKSKYALNELSTPLVPGSSSHSAMGGLTMT